MPHPLSGKPQTEEHIRKRVASIAATKAAWSEERKQLYAERAGDSSRRRPASTYRKTPLFKPGHTPWNKGNCWKDGLSDDQVRAKRAELDRKRRRDNPKAKIHSRVSAHVRFCLKSKKTKKGRVSWVELVGYSVDALEAHLKTTLPVGYCWQDYLDGRLQLDHIVPVSAHNFQGPDDIDFKKCWALDNLRLITKDDNYQKRARLSAPFQPSLAINLQRKTS